MPLQNRVAPDGTIVATASRGTMLGNRGGCFHRTDQTLLPRKYASRQWICCVLEFKNRRRRLMSAGLYTELFFLDEATALSAGHRPCFECRRDTALRFATLWNEIGGLAGRAAAPAMDERLHAERIDPRGNKIRHRASVSDLPDGAMVLWQNEPKLVSHGRLVTWTFDGYTNAIDVAPERIVEVLTPPSIVAILARGYAPQVHGSLVLER